MRLLLLSVAIALIALADASTYTITLGREDFLPGDRIKFINIDDGAHHISADTLPKFQSGWLYSTSYPQKGHLRTSYTYIIREDVVPGSYIYECDAHTKHGMQAKIYVAHPANWFPKTPEVEKEEAGNTIAPGQVWNGE